MKSILTDTYSVHFNAKAYSHLNDFLLDYQASKVFILVDANTNEHCLPLFLAHIHSDFPIEIIEIMPGESSKNIETCVGVWNALSELGADRKSLLINLGGGVVTDLGGFVACTFRRGIKYINVPTSLLAMVDASVGGKTGVDLGTLKNQIGIINSGEMVVVDTSFLETLPQNQLKSGLAEMLKHGLIADRTYWEKLKDLAKLTLEDLDTLIYESIIIKKDLVAQDPFEMKERKYLNFGHTLGHAIESHFLAEDRKPELLHGEAIAIGMVMECYLSAQLMGFPILDCDDIKQVMYNLYGRVNISDTDQVPILELLKYDKKNEHGKINFVLLKAIGKPQADCQVDNALIAKAFAYYKE